jgi:RNA polymerase sigma factor (TIGR02999 family)
MLKPEEMGSNVEITLLLEKWREGDQEALADLMPLIYGQLRQIAGGIMNRERAGHTLSPTAVVNEVYLRLYDRNVSWQDRRHFLAIASREMRRVLVDHARSRNREKRGGDVQRVTLSNLDDHRGVELDLVDMIAVDDAMEKLALVDARKAEVVSLMVFAGLTIGETAETLQLSESSVIRDYRFAKAFLQHELKTTGIE